MATKIKTLKDKGGDTILPKTSTYAVYDSSGQNIEAKISMISSFSSQLAAKANASDVLASINNLQAQIDGLVELGNIIG